MMKGTRTSRAKVMLEIAETLSLELVIRASIPNVVYGIYRPV